MEYGRAKSRPKITTPKMDKEIKLYIVFSGSQLKKDGPDFWEELIEMIEDMDCTAVGGHNLKYLDWMIDYSDSKLEKVEIIENIGDFLNLKEDIINYKIE
jgi:hypothetical protein